jgi:hypothetical protein
MDDDKTTRLLDQAVALARAKAAEFRAAERDAAARLHRMAGAPGGGGSEALSQARDLCAEALVSDREGDPNFLLAQHLLQLAIAEEGPTLLHDFPEVGEGTHPMA